MEYTVKPVGTLRGEVKVPGDKSISHRSVMIGALASGETVIENYLFAADCLSTIKVIRALGIEVIVDDGLVVVKGNGADALKEPLDVLDAGNSGTTMRLMAGILAGCPFYSVLTGDDSLRSRPMGRVIKPLVAMGAKISARHDNSRAPLTIQGGKLSAIHHHSPVASAQVKSAVLLAGLLASGRTVVEEPARSRDHTERMLRHFGARIEVKDKSVAVWGGAGLSGQKIIVPGDISSAMFFIVAGLISPDANLTLLNVGFNPTRVGALTVLRQMGADIILTNQREVNGEPVADITVRGSNLQGVEISGDTIPSLIDELPILSVAAAAAHGVTVVRDAAELRHKESDRIKTVVGLLSSLGAKVEELPDGFVVHGGTRFQGEVTCDSHGDHRIAMTAAVAALNATGPVTIKDAECIKISYPTFFDTLKQITVQ